MIAAMNAQMATENWIVLIPVSNSSFWICGILTFGSLLLYSVWCGIAEGDFHDACSQIAYSYRYVFSYSGGVLNSVITGTASGRRAEADIFFMDGARGTAMHFYNIAGVVRPCAAHVLKVWKKMRGG